ncbi:MAG: DNA polymerase subunit beta [Candidatus Melainabacteria bacterium]|jgi:uncharacterized protein|nr:DNA polymerase subunit beta [Candidatus Melainabacteria bacterium]
MDLYRLVQKKAPDILKLADKHGAENIRLFGSVARKDFHKNSDIDFLIDKGPKEKRSAWFPGGLLVDLEDLLGMEVDLGTASSLKSRLKEHVLLEAIPICDMIEKE